MANRLTDAELRALVEIPMDNAMAALWDEVRRARASEAELEVKVNRVCRWKQTRKYWDTECSENWYDPHGTTGPFAMHYCPGCGGKIEVTP